MGYLKNKYTKEYFTGQDKDGNELNYGATKCLDASGNYTLRDQDRQILEKIDFRGKNVLALGCGRGEELAYAIENGANTQESVGVDFSSAAIRICKKMFANKKLKQPILIIDDALSFVSGYRSNVKKDKTKKFDIVIMFDFVEHVPRSELSKILTDLKSITNEDVLIAINTPAYKYDNDVIKDGFDDRNLDYLLDLSDKIPETKGMHCNKYSRLSLRSYMCKVGYLNITEAHYFLNTSWTPDNFCNISYLSRWDASISRGVPLFGEYRDDIVEYPYSDSLDVKLLRFKKGNLSGVSILAAEQNQESVSSIGDTDPDMMSSIQRANPSGSTIFDVGTYIGTSAMLFSQMVGKGGSVVGFEPNPANRNRTFINLSHNPKYNENVSVFDCALGDENKKQNMLLSMNIDIGYSSTSRLKGSHSTIHDSDLPEGFEELEVEVKTLDVFVKENQLGPSIIKLDIEGAEYEFLLGAVNTIKSLHPILYIELHSQYCALKCSELLISLGYSTEVLHEEDDNRILVKYEYLGEITSKNIKESSVTTAKSLNRTHKMIRELSDDVKKLNQKSSILDKERLELLEQRSCLIEQRDELLSNLNGVQSSRSWKITKPLRIMASALRKPLNK